MKKSIKIIIILGVIGFVFIGVWLNLDSHTKCKLIYRKNICNFYKMIETISHSPEISDFEKAMQLCREMDDVPKKDNCFEHIARVVSFYDKNKAKEACQEIKGLGGIHNKEYCYQLIEKSQEQRLAESCMIAFMESRLRRDREMALNWLTEKAKQQYVQPDLTLVGTSSPHFASYEILKVEKLDSIQFKFKVRIYEEYTGQGEVGFFDETLTVIKSGDKYLIDSVERSQYTDL